MDRTGKAEEGEGSSWLTILQGIVFVVAFDIGLYVGDLVFRKCLAQDIKDGGEGASQDDLELIAKFHSEEWSKWLGTGMGGFLEEVARQFPDATGWMPAATGGGSVGIAAAAGFMLGCIVGFQTDLWMTAINDMDTGR